MNKLDSTRETEQNIVYTLRLIKLVLWVMLLLDLISAGYLVFTVVFRHSSHTGLVFPQLIWLYGISTGAGIYSLVRWPRTRLVALLLTVAGILSVLLVAYLYFNKILLPYEIYLKEGLK